MKKLVLLLLVLSVALGAPMVKSATAQSTKGMDLCIATRPFILENCGSFSIYNITVTFHNGTYYNGTNQSLPCTQAGYFHIDDPEGTVYFWLENGQDYYFLPKTGQILRIRLHRLITPYQAEVSYAWCPAMIYPRTIEVSGYEATACGDEMGTTYGGKGASVGIANIYPNVMVYKIYDSRGYHVDNGQVGVGDSQRFYVDGYDYKISYLSYVFPNKGRAQFVEDN
jgi:hypothetical protein